MSYEPTQNPPSHSCSRETSEPSLQYFTEDQIVRTQRQLHFHYDERRGELTIQVFDATGTELLREVDSKVFSEIQQFLPDKGVFFFDRI